jgi:serine/threonine-protein kinase
LFQAHDDAETLTRVLFEPVRPPSQVCAGAPAELDRIVLQALARDPTKRFATADQMAHALEAAIAPATAAVIGEWVRCVAAEELDARVRLVRDVERRPIAGDAEADLDTGERTLAPTETSRRTLRDRRSLVAAAALALTLVTLGTAWSARARLTGTRTASASIALAPSMGSAQDRGEIAPPSPVPSAATAIDVAPSAGVVPLPVRRAPASRAPKGAPPAKPINSARERLYSQD